MTTLTGVIAAAATPLAEDFSIDLEGLVAHCAHLLDEGGCDGINLLGTTGEATSFSIEQRTAAMRAIAASGLDLSRFMVGTGAAALDDAVALTATAKELGYAGALLLPPFYYKGIDDESLIAYVATVIERVGASGLALYLYHFPANSGVPYPAHVVKRLRDRFPETLVGIKDSSGDVEGYAAGLARELPGFAVCPSAEASLGRAGELGFAGCISATANVTGPYAAAAWRGGDPAMAEAGLAEAVRIRAQIARFPLVASVKQALALMTGRKEWARLAPPLGSLSATEAQELEAALLQTAIAPKIRR